MRMRLLISTMILASSMGAAAMAQDATTFTTTPKQHELTKAEWDKLTPEQRAAKHAERRAKWEAMTPEQRTAAKAERKAKWDALTPQQQAAKKAEHKARFEALPPAEQARIKAERKEWHDTKAETRTQLTPSEEKSQRGHLRRGAGISRPAGVDQVDTNGTEVPAK